MARFDENRLSELEQSAREIRAGVIGHLDDDEGLKRYRITKCELEAAKALAESQLELIDEIRRAGLVRQ